MIDTNLWGEDISVDSLDKTKKLIDKVNNPKETKKTSKISSKFSLSERLEIIKSRVLEILGRHIEDTQVIYSREDLHKYIDASIKNDIIAIDTETNNSLDPLTCKLMGGCIYTYNQKQAYIPINHVDVNTGKRLENQLTEQDIKEEFQRLVDAKTKIVMHNASFDIRVIQCTTTEDKLDLLKRTCGIELPVYWDTQIASRILDENDSSQGNSSLKVQYKKHVDETHDKYDIEDLFEGVEYKYVSPELFALYAATDAMMTLKLYDYQFKEFSKEDNAKILKLFLDIEMPLVKVVKDMELRGIEIDQEYSKRLSAKYHKKIDELQELIDAELLKLKPTVDSWRLTADANKKEVKAGKEQKSKSEKLQWPINLESPIQLAILLYDVLKSPVIDKEKPRGTGDEIVEQMPFEICKLINTRKKLVKLSRDFIDALPQAVNPIDGRIHCSFKQCGTDTGRFSCTEPNLQQIPSHAKEIRLMFKARDGYMICGSDYSGQEPKITAHMSQDENMLKAYREGKDLYAVIASLSFNKPYEECLEFNPITGAKQVEGKERRSQAKSILLGLEYGRGATSIGEQIGKSREEAQKIIDKFFKAFPKVKKWIDETHKKVRKLGYVEDWYGRRRRLPNINLPEYIITSDEDDDFSLDNFNPLLECSNRVNESIEKKIKMYESKLKNVKWSSQVRQIMEEAKKDKINIRCNSNLIAEAERQSVNSIIQGGAATLTKLAMINIDNDEELNKLGFKLLITIHDEVLGECPKENGEQVAKRLTQVMVDTAKPYMNVPMKCDAYLVRSWYFDEVKAELLKEFEELKNKKHLTDEEAVSIMIDSHTEFLPDDLRGMLE